VHSGPIVIGFDGSPASQDGLREAGDLLSSRRAIVTVVWKAGLAFELLELPTATIGLPPAPIDIRTGLEIDAQLYENAQRAAERGAEMARELGLDAEPLVVAEDPDVPVSETLVRVARERDSQAIVVAPHRHGHGPLVLGSTSRDVVRRAPCPVLMAVGRDGEG
jgi:nucleotide-binding universal stress UspA family protein